MNSTKSTVINVIANTEGLFGFDNQKVIVATGLGLVSGTVPTAKPKSILTKVLSKTLSVALKKDPREALSCNDDFLQLVDVTVYAANGSTYKLTDLVLFNDQIIGITLGDLG